MIRFVRVLCTYSYSMPLIRAAGFMCNIYEVIGCKSYMCVCSKQCNVYNLVVLRVWLRFVVSARC